MRTRLSLMAFALAAGLSAAADNSMKSLTGSYVTANRSFEVDPDPDDKRVRMYFELTEEAARDMYRAMNVKPIKNVCGLGEVMVKQKKNIACMHRVASDGHECVFVLNVASGDLENGFSC